MRCVTSFGEEGYKQYGEKFLSSYVESVGLPIDVYVESPITFEHELVTVRDLWKVEGIKEFLQMASFPAAQGNLWGEGKRNYRFDTFKFCRKSFAQIDAASRAPDILIWLDADIEFGGKFVPPAFEDEFMHYMGRPEWHSCASYVAWDTSHPLAGEFFKRYWMLHVTGTIFCLPEWHDSYVLDWLRETTGVEAIDLAKPYYDELKGPANVFDKVFPGHHHKKGNLKNIAA